MRRLNTNNNRRIPDNSLSDAFSTPYIVHGVVSNVTWTQIEPHAGNLLFSSSRRRLKMLPLQCDLQRASPQGNIAGRDRSSGAGLGQWPGGGPMSVLRRSNNASITVPLFWTAEYRKVWHELQKHLALPCEGARGRRAASGASQAILIAHVPLNEVPILLPCSNLRVQFHRARTAPSAQAPQCCDKKVYFKNQRK